MPWVIELRVVSLPATVSVTTNIPNSASVSWPSASESINVLTMSSPGSSAFRCANCMAYQINSPVDPSESYSANSGSSPPIIWLVQSNSLPRSSIRDAEKPGDGLQWQLTRDLEDEITGRLRGGLGGDALRPLVELGAQPLDGPRSEPAGDDLAQPSVLGVVHHQHGQLGGLDLSLDVHRRVEVRDDGLGRRREHVAAQRHLADVAVLADDPEAAVAEAADVGGLLVPPDRRGPPQLGELLRRQPLGVDVGIGEVEARRQIRERPRRMLLTLGFFVMVASDRALRFGPGRGVHGRRRAGLMRAINEGFPAVETMTAPEARAVHRRPPRCRSRTSTTCERRRPNHPGPGR